MSEHPAGARARALIAASDDLDREMSVSPGFVRLNRLARQTRLILWGLIVVVLLLAAVALRADHNARGLRATSSELDQTQAAILVFCNQTNIDNAAARAKFVERFGPGVAADKQQDLKDFADVLFPQRNCTALPVATSP